MVSSFLDQYGLRLSTKEFETVSWDKFQSLLSGLSPDTALGRVVAIRSETDKDILKNYSPEQKKIYDEWRNRQAENVSEERFEREMEELERMFAAMCRN